jgi:hypothetical protein
MGFAHAALSLPTVIPNEVRDLLCLVHSVHSLANPTPPKRIHPKRFLELFHQSRITSHESLTPLESALTKNMSVTPLESALPKQST